MNKELVLNKYFPEIAELRDVQGPTIDALIDGESVLCLMPTGGGKSLIYQVAGLSLEKATVVVSPLVALMHQQCNKLVNQGIDAVCFSGMDFRKQFSTITGMAHGKLPSFIFTSPERISNDGYLEYVLGLRHDEIGLVVVDEAHCISQWGEGFRPAYRNIPNAIVRIFGETWPRILCLTATLNAKQQKQVREEFRITKTIQAEALWRENLNLEIINLHDSREDTKDGELEKIFDRHKGQKILVFAHRKYGNKGTTRTLAEKYQDAYEGVAYFDAGMGDAEKDCVMEGFTDGTVKIVFATSAFGMGVDIPDIRVVVNYLISETVEQYYQEVGRAGRDGLQAWGYLLYTNQSKRGRKMLLNSTLCSEKSLRDEWDSRCLTGGKKFNHVNYESMNDEQRTAFSLLVDYGFIVIVAKGVQNLACFEPINESGQSFLDSLWKFTKTGLVTIAAKKSGRDIGSLTQETWEHCVHGDIRVKSAPNKAIFYTTKADLPDDAIAEILADQKAKKDARLKAFGHFTDGIEAGKTAEELVREALGI